MAAFKKIDPGRIPDDRIKDAASLSRAGPYEDVALQDMPALDAIVCGSVAVTRGGRRCGKGEGYSDLEFAILRELGHPAVPVATTVHPAQIVDNLPFESNDLPLSLIVTPDEVIHIADPPPAPDRIDWSALTDDAFREMPVLAKLRDLKAAGRRPR